MVHIFEDIREIEPVRLLPGGHEALERARADVEPVEASGDGRVVLCAPGERQRRTMRPFQDPMQVGILRRVELDNRMGYTSGDMVGETALHMSEEGGIAPEPTHDGVGEEATQQPSPAPIVPVLAEEARAAVAVAADEHGIDGIATVNQRDRKSTRRTPVTRPSRMPS